MKITVAAFAALAVAGVAACSGGNSSTTPIPSPTLAATAAPSSAPSISPSASPTPTASPAPTATPTIVAALKVIGGAPLTATAAQLSNARRNGQAHTLAQGVTNGIPILVESSGMAAAWAGGQAVWVTNAQTQADIPETAGTITPSGNLPITNPGFTPQSCLGSISAVCIVHPTAWTFGTSSANGKAIGNQTLAISFSDGTTGTTHDYVYDGWFLPACAAGWAYQGGIPVATTTKATSDVYADCANGNLVFPKGAVLYSNPMPDQFGNYATIMPTITSAILLNSLIVNVPMASTTSGQVYGVQTQDGGVAKIYMSSAASASVTFVAEGLSLHAKSDGTYPF